MCTRVAQAPAMLPPGRDPVIDGLQHEQSVKKNQKKSKNQKFRIQPGGKTEKIRYLQ
jgi:hypothetical protein